MLNGKIAIVTGGTRGIGLAVVRTFLHNGAKVALFGSRETSVQRALAQLREEQPDWPVIGLWPDLTDYAAVERAVQEVAQTFGGVDILVNNAGISAREPLADYSPEAFRSIMDLNVTAVFHGCKAVEPIMRAAGKGCIINTSSMVSLYGQPSGVGYPTSKFAVNGLTRSLARELGRAGIRQFGLSRRHADGYGRGPAAGVGRPHQRAHPARPHRRAAGGRQRLSVSCQRSGKLCNG